MADDRKEEEEHLVPQAQKQQALQQITADILQHDDNADIVPLNEEDSVSSTPKKQNKGKRKKKANMKRTFTEHHEISQRVKKTILDGSYDDKLNENTPGTGYVKGCLQNGNWCSWIWTLVFWVGVITMIILAAIDPSDNGYKLCIIPIIVGWCCYTVEWYFVSSTADYLEHVQNKDVMIESLKQLHETQPRIVWTAQAFHYKSEAHAERVKVITHTATVHYAYTQWRDVSMRCRLNEYELTKLKLFKTFEFADDETKQDYDEKFAQFCEENKTDEFQHIDVVMKLPNFTPRVLVNASQEGLEKSKYWNVRCYQVSAWLLCASCYRTQFNSKTGFKSHLIEKEVTIKDMFDDDVVDL